ncbi:MAG: hypothetical protein KDE27_20375 [Planctomycetes bacterium]|nr:hypothetical protein [Planctomycetota bacterium]
MKQVLDEVLAAIDWRALGDVYFHEAGEAELRERQPRIVELGAELGSALGRRLPRGGRSLWVGAGIGELPALLAEVLEHGREVVATNLRGAECDILNRALAAAGQSSSLVYRAVDAREVAAAGAFDHVGCVSLFTDPETWPLLSDVAYGRIAPVQLDVERFAAEREDARGLARALFDALARPGWITTSAEEAPWFLEQATLVGASYDADDELVETAIVGDPVGFLQILEA